eukprot:342143-Prorocentrum_minimum.AAC.1
MPDPAGGQGGAAGGGGWKARGAVRGDAAERGAQKTGARVREGQGQRERLRGPQRQTGSKRTREAEREAYRRCKTARRTDLRVLLAVGESGESSGRKWGTGQGGEKRGRVSGNGGCILRGLALLLLLPAGGLIAGSHPCVRGDTEMGSTGIDILKGLQMPPAHLRPQGGGFMAGGRGFITAG